ncbi:aldehyde dehydrogenase family protein [Nitriliruptor alkaliphilus]|uniref:aldehyde dehydrogenase family protein n=1 Tax=Nitriliruptor alkaliphilus TaxID=427918 RepID=UPI0009FA78AE|nr:aldehyde dehydrogenase family protein [Nitriliruptor alkaliphilus]
MAELFIGGREVKIDGVERLEVRDPARPGTVVGDVPNAGADEVAAAVEAAKEAFASWRKVPAAQRGRLLLAGARRVADATDELAPLLTAENGKPLREARLELHRFVETLDHYAGLARNLRGQSVPALDDGARGFVLKQPIGVVGAIVPWNFPTTLLGNKLGPALIAGNTVVAKPDETTPLTTLRIAQLMHEAGLPDGVFNVVTGLGAVTGEALIRHPDVAKLAFTGSTPVGKHVMAAASERLARVTLELGGSDPLIICDDADVDAAISAASMGRFFNCGQACLAIKRVYVQESVADRVIEQLAAKAEKLKLGPGDDVTTQIGPMHSERGRELLAAQLQDGVDSGGQIVAGGQLPDDDRLAEGWFHAPTVVAEPAHDSRLSQEETFGPVLPVWRVADLEEAVARANASPFALGSSVWTSDLRKATFAMEELVAGYTWVNSRTKVYDELPFGGLKESGYGKEHGIEALDHYQDEKSVVIRD